MPDPAITHLYDWAVLIPVSGVDRFGKWTVNESEASEIRVRWDNTKSESLDAQGNPITLDATIYAAQNIVIGSRMWLGRLADYWGTGSGLQPADIYEVKTQKTTFDIRHRARTRVYGLTRWRDLR